MHTISQKCAIFHIQICSDITTAISTNIYTTSDGKAMQLVHVYILDLKFHVEVVELIKTEAYTDIKGGKRKYLNACMHFIVGTADSFSFSSIIYNRSEIQLTRA